MFTKNWYKQMISRLTGEKTTIKDVLGTDRDSAHDTTGSYERLSLSCTENSGYIYSPSMRYLRNRYAASSGGAVIGTGTTQPTMDDYCLSGDMITTFSYTSKIETGVDEYGSFVTAMYNISNTGTEPFTIGEIALYCNATNAATSATGGSYCIMVERTVLDSPITIAPDGVGQITYTVRFNYPWE